MRKFIGITGVVIAIAAGAGGSASASASASDSASASVVAKSAKWPRSMERGFMNGCGHTSLCRRAMHWMERHYSARQVLQHAGDQRWIHNVAMEAFVAVA